MILVSSECVRDWVLNTLPRPPRGFRMAPFMGVQLVMIVNGRKASLPVENKNGSLCVSGG